MTENKLLCEMCCEPVGNDDSVLCDDCIVTFMMYHERREEMETPS